MFFVDQTLSLIERLLIPKSTFNNTPVAMKLFYHFLFFVFTTLILLACANMFASDPQSKSQTDEFPSPESNNYESKDDSTFAANQSGSVVLANLKDNTPVYSGLTLHNAGDFVRQKNIYSNNFQIALNYFGTIKKIK